mgnify:CR=1 FL=1
MHDHSSAGARHAGRLRFVLVTTALVLAAQVVGALLSGSLALLADAGHALTDVAGLTVALVAVRLGARPATKRHTFGYQRLEVLAALVNALLLLLVGVLVAVEAVQRWGAPPEVRPGVMLVFASIGLVVNLVGLLVLRRGAKESLNVRGAYLEVFSDMLGSLAVVVAAGVIATTGWEIADPLASLAIAAFIIGLSKTAIPGSGTVAGAIFAAVTAPSRSFGVATAPSRSFGAATAPRRIFEALTAPRLIFGALTALRLSCLGPTLFLASWFAA